VFPLPGVSDVRRGAGRRRRRATSGSGWAAGQSVSEVAPVGAHARLWRSLPHEERQISITFALLRDQRIVFRRTVTGGPEQVETPELATTLVVSFLQFVGAGWQTTADAMLANTSAAMGREHQQAAHEYLGTVAA
jgi:hypothetical protein